MRAEDRATYTQRARSEGLEHFEISERSPDRALVRAGDHDEYFPVYYVAPVMGNEAAVGFDLASNPARRRALQKARDTGRMTLTERITLVQEEESQGGVLAILPIYHGSGIPATIESRRSALTGFVLGVFRIGDAVGRVVGPAETPRDLDVYLFDLNAEGEKRLLHFESVSDHDGHLHQVPEADVRNGPHVASEFRVADRTWAVLLRPHADPHAAFDVAAPISAAAVIVLLTLVFSLFVVGSRTRTREIEQEVDERTLALRQSEAQMRLIADSVPALITFVDSDRRFRFVNETAKRWYNRPLSEILGKRPEEVHGDDAHSKIVPYVERVLNGESVTFEADITYGDGRSRDVELNYIPNRNEQGDIDGAFSLVVDISERKQVEESLRDAKEAADAATRAKSEFLANMSHEIRTPLNAVIGFSELMLKTKLSNRQRQFISNIRSSGQNLLELIGDVLDISKIEAGHLELETVRFEIADVMEGISNSARLQAEEKGLDLSFTLKSEVPRFLVGDQMRLYQVLTNLVSNALKFTEKGGISVKAEIAGRLANSATVRFSVTDTGIGISRAQILRLFQSFTQADSSVTRQYGGSGLGLAICKQIVELMGGKIEVDSEPGQGSTFWFTAEFGIAPDAGEQPETDDWILDGETTEPLSAPEVETWSSGALAGLHILVVEDNDLNQEVAVELLSGAGARVSTAGNGNEAIDAVNKPAGQIDAILMDIQMPERDGLEATRFIRDLPGGQDVPIIAMTAHTLAEEKTKCLAAGMNDYLTKPVTPSVLEETILKWARPAVPTPSSGAGSPSVGKLEDLPQIPTDLAVIDVAEALERYALNENLLRRLLGKFHVRYHALISEIRQSVDDRDLALAERLVHTVRGSAGYICAQDVVDAAARLELSLKHREVAELEAEISQLEVALEPVIGATAAFAEFAQETAT